MAQRGGAVISMVKVGPFRGPLIAAGQADLGLFLQAANLSVHGFYLKTGAAVFVNTSVPGDYVSLDALKLAAGLGLSPVSANLILLGWPPPPANCFALTRLWPRSSPRLPRPASGKPI